MVFEVGIVPARVAPKNKKATLPAPLSLRWSNFSIEKQLEYNWSHLAQPPATSSFRKKKKKSISDFAGGNSLSLCCAQQLASTLSCKWIVVCLSAFRRCRPLVCCHLGIDEVIYPRITIPLCLWFVWDLLLLFRSDKLCFLSFGGGASFLVMCHCVSRWKPWKLHCPSMYSNVHQICSPDYRCICVKKQSMSMTVLFLWSSKNCRKHF